MMLSNGTNRRIFDIPLSVQRYKWVQNYIEDRQDIKSVTDLGCGNGRLMNWLKTIPHLELINFVDVDHIQLEFELENRFQPGLCEMLFGRENSDKRLDIKVYHGDLTVPDDRLAADCFIMVEVIEHMLPEHVERAMRTIFGYYQPKLVIITTPNSEFNHLLRQEGEPAGKFRHYDHKFEWTRVQFLEWAQQVTKLFPYSIHFDGVGHLPNSEPFGPCTQIAVFQRQFNGIFKDQKDIICFDLLLDKLNVKEGIPEWEVDRQRKKVSLMTEYCLPACSKVDRSASRDENDEQFDWSSS